MKWRERIARWFVKLDSTELERMLWLGSYSTYTGRTVNGVTALQATAAWACVTLTADIMGALPCKVYQDQSDDTRKEAKEHPLYRILHKQANPYMSALAWRNVVAAHKAIYGNHYSRKVYRERQGSKRELIAVYPLAPEKMRVEFEENQEPTYIYTGSKDGKEQRWTRAEVFHAAGFSRDGFMGVSPIEVCRQSIGLALTAEEFAARYFGNGALPGFVLETPEGVDAKRAKEIRDDFEGSHGGISKFFRLAVMAGGTKLTPIQVEAQKAQLIEARHLQIEEACRIWRIPPHAIQHLLRATNNNIEHQGIELEKLTFLPHCVRFEGDINTQLLSIDEQENGYYAEHNLDGLRRGDYESRVRGEVAEVQNSLLLVNEARRRRNLPPVPGGDVPYAQMQMVPLGTAVPQPEVAK